MTYRTDTRRGRGDHVGSGGGLAGIVAAVSVPTPLREHEALMAFVLGTTWVFLAATAFACVAWIAGI